MARAPNGTASLAPSVRRGLDSASQAGSGFRPCVRRWNSRRLASHRGHRARHHWRGHRDTQSLLGPASTRPSWVGVRHGEPSRTFPAGPHSAARRARFLRLPHGRLKLVEPRGAASYGWRCNAASHQRSYPSKRVARRPVHALVRLVAARWVRKLAENGCGPPPGRAAVKRNFAGAPATATDHRVLGGLLPRRDLP